MTKRIGYTPDMIAWLEAHQAGISRKELTVRFNKEFGMQLKLSSIKNLCARRKWISGITGRIKKGSEPWNKGITGYMGANTTSFKKGRQPHNSRPVGSERVCSKDGYILVKVKEPRTWRGKHVVVWEQRHGKLPKNHCIRFLDNNRTNCDINNLVCIHRGANALINRTNPANTDDSDINHAIILSEQINHTVKTIENQRSKK